MHPTPLDASDFQEIFIPYSFHSVWRRMSCSLCGKSKRTWLCSHGRPGQRKQPNYCKMCCFWRPHSQSFISEPHNHAITPNRYSLLLSKVIILMSGAASITNVDLTVLPLQLCRMSNSASVRKSECWRPERWDVVGFSKGPALWSSCAKLSTMKPV